MKGLSVFVDESGDFGEYNHKSPYYIVTLVIHEQDYSIEDKIENLNYYLDNLKIGTNAIHTAPLIRKEEIYEKLSIPERIKIFNKFFHFTHRVGIKHKSIIVNKKHKNEFGINNELSKQLSNIIKENLAYFQSFDKIIVYYDNGQYQLVNILVSIFTSWFFNKFDYRKVSPYEYKLFQCADLVCTLALIEQKVVDYGKLTQSETKFFGSYRNLKRNYLKHLKKMEF